MKLKKKINVIAVMGPDGSGKTYFINYLIKKLKNKKIIIKRIHLKPALLNSNIMNVSNPHSNPWL